MNKIKKKVTSWLLFIYYISTGSWFIVITYKHIWYNYNYSNNDIMRMVVLLLIYIHNKDNLK
jgi:hypothetical protein